MLHGVRHLLCRAAEHPVATRGAQQIIDVAQGEVVAPGLVQQRAPEAMSFAEWVAVFGTPR